MRSCHRFVVFLLHVARCFRASPKLAWRKRANMLADLRSDGVVVGGRLTAWQHGTGAVLDA